MSKEGFGLARWERAATRLHDYSARLPRAIRERSISDLTELPGGQMWLGLSRPGGLYRGRNAVIEEVPGAPPGNIEAFYVDMARRLWMASSEAGLARIDNPSASRIAIRRYQRSDGLASSETWCLTEDRYGRIYAGTARGVDRLDPGSGRIVHYTHADGLVSGDIRSAIRDGNGDLWFLSNRGLSRFHPTPPEPPNPVNVRITGIRVAGAPHPISEIGESDIASAVFQWSRNSVEIDFAAIHFRSPEKLRYQFRLDGSPGDWSESTNQRSVRFSNLAPGRYRFLVRAFSPDGMAGAKLATFAFTILPAPWRQWWFELIVVGTLLGAAYSWHRFRLNRERALASVRSTIATDLHDDIGATLARIAVTSEALKERLGAADGDLQRMLGQIAESSRSVVEEMSDIVWSIDPRRDNLTDVVARLRAFGSDVLEPRGIRWTCEDIFTAPKQVLLPDQRRQMYLIFKEAIHNIAQHSGARNVLLRIRVQDHSVYAEIHDDGRGTSKGQQPGIGIASMKVRAGRLGGELRIEAGPQGGTRASLCFPLNSPPDRRKAVLPHRNRHL
jgi:hypothetical protein